MHILRCESILHSWLLFYFLNIPVLWVSYSDHIFWLKYYTHISGIAFNWRCQEEKLFKVAFKQERKCMSCHWEIMWWHLISHIVFSCILFHRSTFSSFLSLGSSLTQKAHFMWPEETVTSPSLCPHCKERCLDSGLSDFLHMVLVCIPCTILGLSWNWSYGLPWLASSALISCVLTNQLLFITSYSWSSQLSHWNAHGCLPAFSGNFYINNLWARITYSFTFKLKIIQRQSSQSSQWYLWRDFFPKS